MFKNYKTNLLSLLTFLIATNANADPNRIIPSDDIERNIYDANDLVTIITGYKSVYQITELGIQDGDIKIGDTFIKAKFKYTTPIVLTTDLYVNYKVGGRVLELQKGSQGYYAGRFLESIKIANMKIISDSQAEIYKDLYCFFGLDGKNKETTICFFDNNGEILFAPQMSNKYFPKLFSGTPYKLDNEKFTYEKMLPQDATEHSVEYKLRKKVLYTWTFDVYIDGQYKYFEEIVRSKKETSNFETPFGIFKITAGGSDKSLNITY